MTGDRRNVFLHFASLKNSRGTSRLSPNSVEWTRTSLHWSGRIRETGSRCIGPMLVGSEGVFGASRLQSKPFHLRVFPGAAPTGNHGNSALFTTVLVGPQSGRPPLYSTIESRISHP